MRRLKMIKGLRKNERHGSNREPVGSTITTPLTTAPLESSRQTRALRGAKGFPYAITSTARPTWAGPVTVSQAKPLRTRKGQPQRWAMPKRTVDRSMTRNLGGSTPQPYQYGTG